MDELTAAMRVLLGNTFVMYFKSHSYHWNVEGRDFAQYHSFLGDLYAELHDTVDTTAEQIRALDQYAPMSLEEMYSFKTIVEDTARPSYPAQMFGNLLSANNQVIQSLNKVFTVATAANNQGLCNFVADRLDHHAKHGWMIRSFMKNGD